jgi:hypothetical protein
MSQISTPTHRALNAQNFNDEYNVMNMMVCNNIIIVMERTQSRISLLEYHMMILLNIQTAAIERSKPLHLSETLDYH